MFETLLHLLFVSASALAAGLVAYVAASTLAGLLRLLYARRQPRWLRSLQKQTLPALQRARSPGLARLIVPGLAVALALKVALTGGALIAAFLLLVAAALYGYLGQRATSTAREQMTDAVGELVTAYYSAFLVTPTVYGGLSEAIKTLAQGEDRFVRDAIQRALNAFGTGKSTEEGLDQLEREVQNPYLSQFVLILRHTSESNRQQIQATLQELIRRLDQRKRLQDHSRVALALVSGTVRFLQTANGAIIAAAALAPFWWNFYSASISRQALLVIGGMIALLGSWYFENQLTQLRERVL